MVTMGFIVLNIVSGAFLEEHALHDNLERQPTKQADGTDRDMEGTA